MTSLRSNFVRFLRLSLRGKSPYRIRARFHSPITRRADFHLRLGIERNLASSATFYRASPLNIREGRTARLINVSDDERKVDQPLEYTRRMIAILVRLVIVSSVIITLIAAYLITRLQITRATLFPNILRKGKREGALSLYLCVARLATLYTYCSSQFLYYLFCALRGCRFYLIFYLFYVYCNSLLWIF